MPNNAHDPRLDPQEATTRNRTARQIVAGFAATLPALADYWRTIDAALADVRAGKIGRVPKHLRDAHYAGAKRLGHGKGYRYSHDSDLGVVKQQYLPDALRDATYYSPTEHGNEREISARLEKLRLIIRGE